MSETSKEWRLLRDLDAMPYDSWFPIVRWMAPQLAVENNALLAEIVLRRGQMEIANRDGLSDHAKTEQLSFMFAKVGLEIVIAEQAKGGAA
jgi:hypothetical protein